MHPLDSCDRKEGVMYFCALRDSGPMTHQLLDGHPVVQDLFVTFLHHLFVTKLQDVYLLPALGSAGRSLLETLKTALLHELSPLPLLPGSCQVLLPLLLAPVTAHLHLTHSIVICSHTSASLFSNS